MYRTTIGIGFLFCFVLGIVTAASLVKDPREMRIDIALSTLIFGIPGAVLVHTGQKTLKTKKIILEMSLDMLKSEECIDINRLSILTETTQPEIVKYLKAASIDHLVKNTVSQVKAIRS